MTMRARGIAVPGGLPKANMTQMGDQPMASAMGGIGEMAKLEQSREGFNEELRAKNKSGLAKIGSAAGGVVGGVVGGIYGGPAGGYAGAMIGSAAGGMLGGML